MIWGRSNVIDTYLFYMGGGASAGDKDATRIFKMSCSRLYLIRLRGALEGPLAPRVPMAYVPCVGENGRYLLGHARGIKVQHIIQLV